jgi:hypothetical protein
VHLHRGRAEGHVVAGILSGERPGSQEHQTGDEGQAERGQIVLPDEG